MNRAHLCPHFCPVCLKRLYQRSKPTSYRCNCGRSFDLVAGEMRPKVRRVVAEVVVVEVEMDSGYRMSADEYEAMQNAPQIDPRRT